MVHVRLFAGAAESVGAEALTLGAQTLGELTRLLSADGGREVQSVLERCSFLVNGVRKSAPETPLAAGATVDVMPPFAGG
ncbi:MoaD/ThiS family protein [Lysinibacter sp. HNR]|uniref:MoaD/ThiS family protein n=1 Tax=Lysinibacter sp. HNR TaxID=3031408 RepID=UPI0024348906|nr:MoaD/ThiS family protein [Lysinibacter sp. HNR]WGD36570.1 MoaD/ThiS family protein [Lysinibacter sp. HNR]